MQKNTSMNDNQHKDSKKSSYEGYREIINPIKPHAKTQSNTKKNSFIESYFFYPKLWHKILAYALLPFSCIYISIALCKKYLTKKMRFDIKILSIGNLVSGGSGKTPFCIALTQHLHKQGYTNIYIVSRGYKRKSKGLIQVSCNGKILCDVAQSGDEAMLLATQTQGNVIVSEDRTKALEYIQTLTHTQTKQNSQLIKNIPQNIPIVILDDAYRFNFNKFDILLEPTLKPYFPFVLPSGYYRFPKRFYKKCDLHLKENKDYKRKVSLYHLQDSHIESKYILATAIANPSRLKPYLPKNVVYEYYLADHADFDFNTLSTLLKQYNATHILMTQKDYVKCMNFMLPVALLMLDITIESYVLDKIESFLSHTHL
ncbi:tetraacyldisaccharide 4'-kinase [Helicobacter trogontum]|nr:tetraacyldisaccharide 4'-kinase [Helicobacter trogontum]MDY5185215.1 tetraacyldisaccharide 4'-kinase [Helicobacter trogontum]